MSAQSPPPTRWEGFLNRAPLVRDRSLASAALQGKNILITGAGGSIGSALALAVAEFAPRLLILLEASERNLYDLEKALHQLPFPVDHVLLLGSVSDAVLLEEIFRNRQPHIVYHAAAFKHVPLTERNPFAAIENNTLATDLLHRLTLKHEAEQFILLSTDKAADPVSIMGASKRIAELVLLAQPAGSLKTKAVRLGNVLGSEGSIVPLFLQQIAAGTAVTVTHPDIQRYFLTCADAVTLLLLAASPQAGQGILVPDLGQPFFVAALARYLLADQGGDADAIRFTQPRPGDKMCEVLLSRHEVYRDAKDGRLLLPIQSPSPDFPFLQQILLELRGACDQRSLERLLRAILRLVPEYRPSALLRPHGQPVAEPA